MAFEQRGSPQANAAPLQSYVKSAGVSVQPTPMESMKNAMVPRPSQNVSTAFNANKNQQMMMSIEPVFAYLLFRNGGF